MSEATSAAASPPRRASRSTTTAGPFPRGPEPAESEVAAGLAGGPTITWLEPGAATAIEI